MTLYTGHVESIRNVTQLTGMIFLFPPTPHPITDLNQALFIFGGWVPGSAGCIDLTSNIDNFVALFDYIGNDLIIKVEY